MPVLPRLRHAVAAAAVLVLAAAPARAQTWTLLHEFKFTTDLASSVNPAVTGTLVGAASLVDGALRVGGASGYAQYAALIPAVSDWNSSRWSVSVWARQRVAQTAGDVTIVGQGVESGFSEEYQLGLSSAGKAVTRNRSGWAGGAFGTNALTPGTWHHYTTVMFDNGAVLYVDGVLQPVGAAGFYYPCCYYGGSMRVGRQVSTTGQQFDGDIDDLRIYRGVFDQASITAQYQAGRTGADGLSVAPEPATLGILGTGVALLVTAVRRRRAG